MQRSKIVAMHIKFDILTGIFLPARQLRQEKAMEKLQKRRKSGKIMAGTRIKVRSARRKSLRLDHIISDWNGPTTIPA
ncbi:hypothetical protein [Agrobacterium sp. RS6]|uniref:hypothetical protein n=1 Tax=Agrobacterium sp. RS6 TaxID=2489001 RepID=UPI000FDF0E02|nr:hypothetical protein [Agrobacterium sp. RS6]